MKLASTLPMALLSTIVKIMVLATTSLNAYFDDISGFANTAGMHEVHFGCHRKPASRHPYLIYYRVASTGVEIAAVLDGRRCPSEIDEVLRER